MSFWDLTEINFLEKYICVCFVLRNKLILRIISIYKQLYFKTIKFKNKIKYKNVYKLV